MELPTTTTRRAVVTCAQYGTDHAHYDASRGICCRDCGSMWFGLRACHCAGCHSTFTGESAFAVHSLKLECRHPAFCVSPDTGEAMLEQVDGYWRQVQGGEGS